MFELSDSQIDNIQSCILNWFAVHKRDLPWRGATPYAIWVSEIMLQQTQVATVIPYFNRFMERFPNVEVLANAGIDDVLQLWSGLGYYARARNLHNGAKRVVQDFGGSLPASDELCKLPGIGPYTAGALLSIAFNLPRPIVDGNVIRVLTRLFGIHGDPKSGETNALIWDTARRLVPELEAGNFNQGLMELGALVCRPNEPYCDKCPLVEVCEAAKLFDPTIFPELAPNKTLVNENHVSLLIADSSGNWLLHQRPLKGLWGGLWEFPRTVCGPGEKPQEAIPRLLSELAAPSLATGKLLTKIKHTVTHHRITLYAYHVQGWFSNYDAAYRYVSNEELNGLAFSAPQAILRQALLRTEPQKAGAHQPELQFEPAQTEVPKSL